MYSRRVYALVTTAVLLIVAVAGMSLRPPMSAARASPGSIAAAFDVVDETTTSSVSFGHQQPSTEPQVIDTTIPRAAASTSEPDATGVAEPPGSTSTTTPAATTTSTSPPPPDGDNRDDLAGQFVTLINELRTANGLASLDGSGSLNAEARAWAQVMGEAGELSHSSLGRLLPPWSAAAENVATGGTVGSVFSSLEASSGHLSNMLGDYTHVGSGVWVDTAGRLWTVQLFAR